MLKLLDLFSGIGGFSLAASWTGQIQTVGFCEIEPFCQRILRKHWPEVPIFPDIKELRGRDIGPVDIVSGGFPCQPFSCAGKRKGKEDDRYLWPEMFRVIQEARPTWVIGENVANIVNMGLQDALSDLESGGFEVQIFNMPACGVGAPHERQRIWILAHSESARQHNNIFRGRNHLCKSQKNLWGEFSPGSLRMANGVSSRVDRIRGLGNAIVPQVAYEIFKAIVNIENNK